MDLVDSEAPELKLEQDEVVAYWQKFVPGLVSLPQASMTSTVASNQNDGSATGHKLLVEPSVFNITSLLPPSVSFLKRLRDLIPPGSDIVLSTISSFLNDFLTNVFHPQLEETLVEFCSQSYLQADSLQEHPQWSRFSQKPILKGSVTFFEVTSAFCQMLDELTHDQLFSQLVIKQMHTYHDKCNTWYRTLVSRAQAKSAGGNSASTLKASAHLAESSNMTSALTQIWKTPVADHSLYHDEAHLMNANTSLNTLDEFDLISDNNTQHALCLLYTSMRWMAIKLGDLRHISPRADEEAHAGMDVDDMDDRPQLKRSLTRALVTHDTRTGHEPVHLPLNKSTAALFDGIVTGFRELSDSILRTLRLEMRCQAVHGLRDSFTGSLLYPTQASLSSPSIGSPATTSHAAPTAAPVIDASDAPDESLLTLVTHLLDFNAVLAANLPTADHARITTGLSTTIDAIVLHFMSGGAVASNGGTTSKASALVGLNTPAAAHLLTNVRVLHHNLLNIEASSALPRSTAFLELFLRGQEAIVAEGGAGGASAARTAFSKGDLRALLGLVYSEQMGNKDLAKAAEGREGLEAALRGLDG